MKILEYALQMELDGEAFYRELALENKDNNLHSVFIYLADTEKKHAAIIKEKQISSDYMMDEDEMNEENIFSSAGRLDAEKSTDKQINAYRKALEMEKKSIDLYKNLLSESNENKEVKDIFEFLIKQEEKQYKLIEEIIRLVNRPIEWVESAEFGSRNPY